MPSFLNSVHVILVHVMFQHISAGRFSIQARIWDNHLDCIRVIWMRLRLTNIQLIKKSLNVTTSSHCIRVCQLPRRGRERIEVSVQINPHQATTSLKVTSDLPFAMSLSVEWAAVIFDSCFPDSLKKMPAVRARFLSSGSSTPATLQRNADRRIVSSPSTRGDIISASTFQ
jgi:hypothetical protein